MSAVPPTDRRYDRRAFLRRMGALTAAASAGAFETAWSARPASAASAGATTPTTFLPLPEVTVQTSDPSELTVVEAATLIGRGELSPVELVEAHLARIRAYDGVYQAFNTVTEESALASARRAEESARASAPTSDRSGQNPLRGIPLAIKDNYFTAGVATTANSHIFAEFVPEYDAESWARLRAAGAILIGKTQMGPLATSRATTPDGETTTTNAWAPGDPSVSPGGSSSGSATAVAGRMASGSTGTQTGGSITNPSDAQGLTGLKPTMGRVSLRGIIPLTYTRDHPGPIARDARDAALLLQTMAGPDPADPRTLGQPPVPDLVGAAQPVRDGRGRVRLRWPTRIGVFPDYLGDAGDAPRDPGPEAPDDERARFRFMTESWERRRASGGARAEMLDTFRTLGAEIVEVEPPRDWETLTSGEFNNVRLPERAEPFLEHLRRDVRLFGVSLSPWINGLLLPGTEYLRGQRAKLLLLRRVLDEVFSVCDVVVQTQPFPFDIIGLPLIAFPIGMRDGPSGPLPLGGMLGGMPFAEDRLLSLAGAYQEVTDWHRRRPADPGITEPGAGTSRLDVFDVWEACE